MIVEKVKVREIIVSVVLKDVILKVLLSVNDYDVEQVNGKDILILVDGI